MEQPGAVRYVDSTCLPTELLPGYEFGPGTAFTELRETFVRCSVPNENDAALESVEIGCFPTAATTTAY